MTKKTFSGNKKIIQGSAEYLRGKISRNRLKQLKGIGHYLQGKALLKLPF